ncbi:uncharacterized protein LOC122368238 [Amphibalanus amphitrite]|uniref:uncharacterized protein LOC122368238 n=1 Tax=Amphibalanus amphitrite TaxID=1232801 RepID=UPI001C9136E4|nr:uncharacterized protein LOC122368238 [Amphibalanus amphitrite]
MNLSSRTLNDYESEALALGLKFDSGRDKYSFADHVERNYRWNDSDVEKGYIQGILTCCKALSDKQPGSLPRRYLKALRDLANDSGIIVTQADKGGGIVIMDRAQYIQKMQDLLSDKDTYEKKGSGFNDKENKVFNKEARKILKRSERGKKLQHALEEAPTAPKMRGLPKVHKSGTPMRPITSGIGSAPHKLAKILAKPLTNALGSISGAHIKNTAEMMETLKEVRQVDDKKLASFDVRSLFTNVPVDEALEAIKEVVDEMDENALPLPKNDYLKLVSMCMHFGSFTFDGIEYLQKSGLAMGSPLSPVAACLFMEKLEKSKYSNIIGSDSTWIRYVDDVLVVVPKNMNLEDKLQDLNEVHEKIQFTIEKEENDELHFLDTCIIKSESRFKFKVFRKPTSKEDYVHFYSGHSEKVKSGIVIGFFLRAFRVCDDEYLQDEIEHIYSSFMRLKYPKGFLIKQKETAKKIRNRSQREARPKSKRWITIPNSKEANEISRTLQKGGVNVAISSGKKIGELIERRKTKHGSEANAKSVVYEIPCKGCGQSYVKFCYKFEMLLDLK